MRFELTLKLCLYRVKKAVSTLIWAKRNPKQWGDGSGRLMRNIVKNLAVIRIRNDARETLRNYLSAPAPSIAPSAKRETERPLLRWYQCEGESGSMCDEKAHIDNQNEVFITKGAESHVIDAADWFQFRSSIMSVNTKPGDKVCFMGKNGYDAELKRACETFCIGQVLTVKEHDVGGFSSSVMFMEFPNVWWNTAMFRNA